MKNVSNSMLMTALQRTQECLGGKAKPILLIFSMIVAMQGSAKADLLPLEEIVNTTQSSSNDFSPAVFDGLDDAFDLYGVSSFGTTGLDGFRQIDTLEDSRSYRLYDSFTNNTGTAIAATILYSSNLGSDSSTSIISTGPQQSVSFEGPIQSFNDPVVAFTTGNNAFTLANAISSRPGSDGFDISYDIMVNPGATVSILQYASLIKDDTDRAGDVATAIAQSNLFLTNPDLTGLSAGQISSIVNFDTAAIPEPACAAILLPLCAIALRRRR